jgi:uracil-DNA glycosylase
MACKRSIAELSREIAACRLCRDRPQFLPRLPHEPRPVAVLSATARILIAGQAPGLRVHETSLPFNDRSGDRLRQWLGVTRETFYDSGTFAIAPIGLCFPGYDGRGGDLPPRRECAPRWRAQILSAMPQIELVVCIGQYAHAWHIPGKRGATLGETVRNWRAIAEQTSDPCVVPLPHPSWRNTGWLKANPWFEAELVPWLRLRVRELIPEVTR